MEEERVRREKYFKVLKKSLWRFLSTGIGSKTGRDTSVENVLPLVAVVLCLLVCGCVQRVFQPPIRIVTSLRA